MTAILKLDYYRKEKPKKETGIIKKPGSNKLYVDLRPNGIRVQRSSGLDDTTENREKLRDWVNRQQARIKAGTFEFGKAFPNAPEKEKAKHASLEGRAYKLDSSKVLFGDYCDVWVDKNLAAFTPGKRRDYENAIYPWIKPFFADKSFGQITGVTVKDFIKTLNHRQGRKKGQPLSKSRVNNLLIVLRAIWYDAVEEHQWEKSDPFSFCKRFLKEELKKRPQKAEPEVLLFSEWLEILDHMDPHYKPAAETMIMTGMIGSEIAGLKKTAVKSDRILVENSIVKGHEKAQLKTNYRKRELPLTQHLKKALNQAMAQTDSEYVFSSITGLRFSTENFGRYTWPQALKKAKVKYRVPYTLRHSFAAWSLVLDVHPNRLVKLMGHGSKKMVYEVYGQYVDGLEQDMGEIREYYGYDFR
ncbi:tyrosine-type recombinase/integrase [Desulfobacter curvatus]|uniref:tyrosine-type recombinase/integrase n=1 Tax=Desulfobacter curvatus TaxID=2290 RepID=UPI00146EC422|nr:tyrosine-type recombinase/integrase [Desulfobacter curvatus]